MVLHFIYILCDLVSYYFCVAKNHKGSITVRGKPYLLSSTYMRSELQDWLKSLWLTGETQYVVPASQKECQLFFIVLSAMDSYGIVRI